MNSVDIKLSKVVQEYIGKETIMVTPEKRGSKIIKTEVLVRQSLKNIQSSFAAEGVEFSDNEVKIFMALTTKAL